MGDVCWVAELGTFTYIHICIRIHKCICIKKYEREGFRNAAHFITVEFGTFSVLIVT